MSLDPYNFDFTERDFSAVDLRLKDLASSVFEDLTDQDTINFINLMRKKFAFVLSLNDYYIHKAAREAFVGTMTQRKSAINHGQRQGYTLSGASAATVDLVATLTNAPLPGTVTIAEGDVVRTLEVTDPVRGEIQAEVQFAPGDTTKTLSWKHSISRSASFTADGSANQSFFLSDAPYLDDSLAFSTAAGAWTQVDNFLLSESTSRHFVVKVDQNDRATFYTGDGVNGAKPDGTFTAYYETGGGSDGNVEPNSLVRFETEYTDSLGNKAFLTVTNAVKAEDGTDRETVDQARVNIPADRTLPPGTTTREDFEIRADAVSGVGRSLMLTSDLDATVPENEGRLYIIPTGGGTPSSALIAAVEATFVTYPAPPTFTLTVSGATYLTIDVDATIWIAQGYSATTVKAAITSALTHFFEPIITTGSALIGQYQETASGVMVPLSAGMKNPLVDFGYYYQDENGDPVGEIAWSDVFNIVRDTAGVRKLGAGADEFLLNEQRDDVAIDNFKFPAFGTLTLRNGATGNVI